MTEKELDNITKLDNVIASALEKLADLEKGSEDFTKTVNQLKILYSIKETIADTEAKGLEASNKTKTAEVELKLKELEVQRGEREMAWKLPVKPEVLVPAAASIIGIIIVVAYEHTHIVTSKALGAALRFRS